MGQGSVEPAAGTNEVDMRLDNGNNCSKINAVRELGVLSLIDKASHNFILCGFRAVLRTPELSDRNSGA